jgi:ribosomal protein S27AE
MSSGTPPPRPTPPPAPASTSPAGLDAEDTTCPRCGESHDLAKVKGCIKCLKCGFKFDCNGW